MTKVMQVAPAVFARIRNAPMFPALETLAHTLSFDVRITARGPSLVDRAKVVRAKTLAMRGEAAPPWMTEAIGRLVAAIPGARAEVLAGQTHDVDPNVLALSLEAFFAD